MSVTGIRNGGHGLPRLHIAYADPHRNGAERALCGAKSTRGVVLAQEATQSDCMRCRERATPEMLVGPTPPANVERSEANLTLDAALARLFPNHAKAGEP